MLTYTTCNKPILWTLWFRTSCRRQRSTSSDLSWWRELRLCRRWTAASWGATRSTEAVILSFQNIVLSAFWGVPDFSFSPGPCKWNRRPRRWPWPWPWWPRRPCPWRGRRSGPRWWGGRKPLWWCNHAPIRKICHPKNCPESLQPTHNHGRKLFSGFTILKSHNSGGFLSASN